MDDEEKPRRFASDAAIERIGQGLLACSLPKAEWTHEAHLGATCWLVAERSEVDVDRELPGIIRRYNESVGGVNDETQGYHETITRCFLHGVRLHLAGVHPDLSLVEKVNRLLESPQGRRDWPLRFYSRERLFSREARLNAVEPDVEPFPSLP